MLPYWTLLRGCLISKYYLWSLEFNPKDYNYKAIETISMNYCFCSLNRAKNAKKERKIIPEARLLDVCLIKSWRENRTLCLLGINWLECIVIFSKYPLFRRNSKKEYHVVKHYRKILESYTYLWILSLYIGDDIVVEMQSRCIERYLIFFLYLSY